MDERQQRVLEVLIDRSPRLAGMYRTALAIIATEAMPGCEAARISTICHCIRELMSGLPAVMSDISIPRPHPSSNSIMQKLPEVLAAHPDADLALDQDLVPVPGAVARVLASLVSAVTQEQGRNRANTAALVTGNSDANHPAISQWRDAYQFFLSWTQVYDLLTPAIIAAVRSPVRLTAGWQGQSEPMQRIGEWVIEAIIRGDQTLEDPVAQAFFSTAEPRVRGAAVGRIAWLFMHANSVDGSIRDRLAGLWDGRVEHVREHPEDKHELHEFYWFVRSGKFDVTWWLPRLKEAVELDPDLAGERWMLGKQIASSADVDPRGALAALEVLLKNGQGLGNPVWGLTNNAVPMVIARAMSAGDEQLRQDAVRFMNELGENGNPNLEKEVKKVLVGKITQDDVSEE